MSNLDYSEEDGLYEGSSPRRRYRDDDFGRSSESDVSDSHLEDMELVPKGAQAGRASPSDFLFMCKQHPQGQGQFHVKSSRYFEP